MAQEVSTISPKEKPANLAKSEVEADLSKTLSSFLRGYNPTDTKNGEIDTLNYRYRIEFNSPLPDFNSKTTLAYAAKDIKNSDKEYLALICEPSVMQRIRAISPLINSPHPNLMILVAYGVVELSKFQAERFVILYEKPKGEKLSKLILTAKKRPSFEFICYNIIAPLAQTIQHLSDLGIPHGNINCDNIYFDSATLNIIIGTCVTEPCGLSQPFYYEPVERMQALPAGKGEGSSAQDFYALAVVTLHIIYGINHFKEFTEDSLIKEILKEGAYDPLTRRKDMPEVFYDFFRGLLSYNAHDRWNYRYLKTWLDGKRYNVMPTPPPQEAIRPFEFEGEEAYTRREVAHIFFQNWQAVPEVFANGQLSNWVAISLRNKELNEYLIRATKTIASSGIKNDSYMDEQIMRVINVFDLYGPIRLRKLSFHLDGISSLFAEMVFKNSKEELQLLMQFIELSMFHFIAAQRNKETEKNDESGNENIDAIFIRLDRMRSIIRNTGIGFGIERIFYDLNVGTKCISPLFAGLHVSSLPEMLKALDRLAPRLSDTNDPIDKHIAAFIASHLNIQHDIHLTSLSSHPTLAKSHVMIALKLLATAQHRTGIPHLPGLTNWLAIRILPLLDVIRSRTLKRKLIAMLANSARSGNIVKMEELLIESGYSQAETNAYQQAINNFKQNANDIIYYSKGEMIDVHSKRLGIKMAHYIAVFVLLISFILSVRAG
jgi:serine/threonine protein kinase